MILACIMLMLMDDPVGASIAWSVTILALNAVFIPLYAARIMEVSPVTFVKPVVLCYLVFGLMAGAGALLVNYWTMPSTFLWIMSTALIGFIVYALLVFFLFLNWNEKKTLLTYFPESFQNLVLKMVH